MTQRLAGIAIAVIGVTLAAGVAVAQRADETTQQNATAAEQQVQQAPPPVQQPPPPAQQGVSGQVGPQRGQGQRMGRMGMGMGPGPGAGGFGQGAGRGIHGGFGQGAGRGRGGQGMMGRGGRGQGGPGGAGMGLGAGRGGPFARLDLTADQRTAIQTLQSGARDQSAGLGDELELARKTLHRELFADKRDAARIASLSTKVTTLEKQLFDAHLKTRGAIADLLTPAQREAMRIGR